MEENKEQIIKFRAWIKKSKSMIFLSATAFGDLTDNWSKNDYSIMQFIGCLDKNGKEIYEGDILKVIFCRNFGKNDVWYEQIYKIIYEMGTWGYEFNKEVILEKKRKKDKDLLKDFDNFSDGVVIGNIYENSELLKENIK